MDRILKILDVSDSKETDSNLDLKSFRKSPKKEVDVIALKKIITNEDISQIKIQKMARKLAKEIIATKEQRRECIRSIISDNEIDQLIKDGQVKKAEKRAITILRNWK